MKNILKIALSTLLALPLLLSLNMVNVKAEEPQKPEQNDLVNYRIEQLEKDNEKLQSELSELKSSDYKEYYNEKFTDIYSGIDGKIDGDFSIIIGISTLILTALGFGFFFQYKMQDKEFEKLKEEQESSLKEIEKLKNDVNEENSKNKALHDKIRLSFLNNQFERHSDIIYRSKVAFKIDEIFILVSSLEILLKYNLSTKRNSLINELHYQKTKEIAGDMISSLSRLEVSYTNLITSILLNTVEKIKKGDRIFKGWEEKNCEMIESYRILDERLKNIISSIDNTPEETKQTILKNSEIVLNKIKEDFGDFKPIDPSRFDKSN